MPDEQRRAPHGRDSTTDYHYRRTLGGRDLLPAIGAGAAAGLATFYVVRLLLQRTPLVVRTPASTGVARGAARGRRTRAGG